MSKLAVHEDNDDLLSLFLEMRNLEFSIFSPYAVSSFAERGGVQHAAARTTNEHGSRRVRTTAMLEGSGFTFTIRHQEFSCLRELSFKLNNSCDGH